MINIVNITQKIPRCPSLGKTSMKKNVFFRALPKTFFFIDTQKRAYTLCKGRCQKKTGKMWEFFPSREQIFGKSWEFGPTGLTPPLPERWEFFP